jgi:hypothetical protein
MMRDSISGFRRDVLTEVPVGSLQADGRTLAHPSSYILIHNSQSSSHSTLITTSFKKIVFKQPINKSRQVDHVYEGVTKSFRTGFLEQELQIVEVLCH